MPVPCDCCPVAGLPRCAPGEVAFSNALIAANPAGLPITNLASTIDGTEGTDLSGFAPPVSEAQLVANPTTGFDYVFAAPVDNLVRLRWHNGGGGVLTDQDGFGLITVTLLDAGLAPLYTTPWDLTAPIGNNAIVREINFPPVSGVARVRFNQFHKQNVGVFGTGSPLLRQVEAFTYGPVFPCRRRGGALEWYTEGGLLVPAADVVDCSTLQPPAPVPSTPTPFSVPDLHLLGGAFNDDPGGQGENLCNLVPAPSTTSGWTAPSGGCYDPTTGTPTMDWAATTNLDFTFGGPNTSGGVFMHFSSPSLGAITWPANAAQMAIGEQRWSNFFGGGHRARMTYISGSGGSMQMAGGTQLNVHFGSGIVVTNNRFLLEFFTP